MESKKRKIEEDEALKILKLKGMSFKEDYGDDGKTGYSKPDLQYTDGRYLEVTHTLHNNGFIKKTISDDNKCAKRHYMQKSIEKQNEESKAAIETYDRLMRCEYPMEQKQSIGKMLTPSGMNQFKQDQKAVKNHFGYDVCTGKWSEFNCDIPIIEHSNENILRVVQKKGKKYTKGDTDLFIFVTEEEYDSMIYLIKTRKHNDSYNYFCNALFNSPFPTVFICKWNFDLQRYIINDADIMKFWKNHDGSLHYKQL